MGGLMKDKGVLEGFKETIDFCNLKDIKSRGPPFTWCNRRNFNNIWERLDRFLCNDRFEDMFQDSFALHLDWSNYDNRPIKFNIQEKQGRSRKNRNKAFKFEECWTKYLECQDVI